MCWCLFPQVLLDVGMIAKLTQEDQHNLVGFFKVRGREHLQRVMLGPGVRRRWSSLPSGEGRLRAPT